MMGRWVGSRCRWNVLLKPQNQEHDTNIKQYADTQEQYQLVSEPGRVTYKGEEIMKLMEYMCES